MENNTNTSIAPYNPLGAAFSSSLSIHQAQRKIEMKPRKREKLEFAIHKNTRELIDCWKTMRRYSPRRWRYKRAERKAQKLEEKITQSMEALGVYQPTWYQKLHELFETQFI